MTKNIDDLKDAAQTNEAATTTTPAEVAESETAALEKRRVADFKKALTPKLKATLVALKKVEDMRGNKNAYGGAVDDETIKKFKDYVTSYLDEAVASLEYLRDYVPPKTQNRNSLAADKIEIDL